MKHRAKKILSLLLSLVLVLSLLPGMDLTAWAVTVPVTGVTVDPTSATLTAGGDPVALTAAVSPADATDKTVIWNHFSSVELFSDPGCTSLISTGTAISNLTVYVKGIREGSGNIFVSSNSNHTSASCAVTVNVEAPTVTITPAGAGTVDFAWDYVDLTLTATANSGYEFDHWSYSKNEYNSTLGDNQWTEKTLTSNPNTIYYYKDGFSEYKDFTAHFKSTSVDVQSVTLDPTSATLTAGGDPVALTAAVSPADATDKKVKWNVGGDNPGALALYSDANCTAPLGTDATETLTVYAKGTAAGSATVTVTSNADATKSADCEVTVNAAGYTVTLSGGANATIDGATSQTGLTGDMTTVTYTANSGNKFPETSELYKTTNGITVARTSDTVVTVYGTPTANVNITVPDAAAIPTYTVTYVANNGTEDKFGPNTMTIPYRVEGNMFVAPDGMKFVDWLVKGTTTHYTEGTNITSVSGNLELVAQWESVNNGGNQGGQNNQGGDVVFYGCFGGGDGWSGGYVTGQRAWRVSLAPMQGGSAALVLNTGESGETMNVYPQTTVRVVPSPDPGYRLASIVWSLIDGSASYDITQSQTFVMPAMDAVVHVNFVPVG